MKIRKIPFIGVVLFSYLFAEKPEESDTALISEGFGHMIGRHLEFLEVEFDTALFIKGIQNARDGKEPPISEKECIEAIHSAQEKTFKILCEKNLKQAEIFLANHAKEEGVIALEEGKIQYQIISQGKGLEIKPHSSPLIRYIIKKLDGSVIGIADQPEPVSLDETIVGLKKGLVGMKEEEKRILYIHPDLSYGVNGSLLFPPNMLLIFEIEVLKANTQRMSTK